MLKYPKALENLMEDFMSLPSIGRKTAERLALYVYTKMEKEEAERFGKDLTAVHQQIHTCRICGNICESETCDICRDETRNHRQILVVETVKDLFTIENVNEYHGVYHVLNGAISISKGITMTDLNLSSFLDRVTQEPPEEIILATNATLEGETTARYIKELLREKNMKITRIAHGLPVGSDLSYADEMTLLKAMEGRREY